MLTIIASERISTVVGIEQTLAVMPPANPSLADAIIALNPSPPLSNSGDALASILG
jgi:hypothetical protein